jgi:hypothetical protein
VRPDEEGHVLTSGTRYELRNTDFPMRVQIYEASDKATVLALLGKAHTWLERDWEGLTTPSPPQAPDKQRTEEERAPIRAEGRRVREVRNEPQPDPPPPPRRRWRQEGRQAAKPSPLRSRSRSYPFRRGWPGAGAGAVGARFRPERGHV